MNSKLLKQCFFIVTILLLNLLFGCQRQEIQSITTSTSSTSSTITTTSMQTIVTTTIQSSRISDKPILYIVLDDAGHNLEDSQRFFELPIPLTFAILPDLKYSSELAQAISATKHAVILHQPMQAISNQDPGPGVLKRGMSAKEVDSLLEKNTSQLGAILAINNHMGSLGTSDAKLMSHIFAFLKKKNMGFLDSRTSAKTVARKIHKDFNVPLIERDIFLDNLEQEEAIRDALQRGLVKARKEGYAVMIGHVWSDELAKVLFDVYPQILEEGFDFDTIASWFLGAKGLSPANPEAPIFFETGHVDDDSPRY